MESKLKTEGEARTKEDWTGYKTTVELSQCRGYWVLATKDCKFET